MATDVMNFRLFTTLRWDLALCVVATDPDFERIKATQESNWWNRHRYSPIYMLDQHRDRLLRAAVHFEWTATADCIAGAQGLKRLELLIEEKLSSLAPPSPSNEYDDKRITAAIAAPKPHRVKIFLTQNAQLTLETAPVPAVPLHNLLPVGGLSLLFPNVQQLGMALPPCPKTMKAVKGQEEKQRPESMPLQAVPTQPIWRILVDLKNPIRRSVHTDFKTTRREPYDAAQARAGLKPTDPAEVLLVTTAGEGEGEEQGKLMVMDGTYMNPYFWRGGRWVTPPLDPILVCEPKPLDPATSSTGGLDGTTWQGLVIEEAVVATSLDEGEMCWVSNGVEGVRFWAHQSWVRHVNPAGKPLISHW